MSTTITKEYFTPADPDTAHGTYRARSVASGGSHQFNFKVPHNFESIASLVIVGYPTAGAAGTGKDIDLTSEYGALGQSKAVHTESDTTATYDLGTTDVIFELDLAPVFTSLAAGDYCGILVDQQVVGGTVYYLGIRLRYN